MGRAWACQYATELPIGITLPFASRPIVMAPHSIFTLPLLRLRHKFNSY